MPDSVRLLLLGFEFRPLLDAADRGEAGPMPEPADARVAVARSGWRVRVHALDPWRYAFLEALGPEGADVQCAAADAAAAASLKPADVLARLSAWLPDAAREGLVARG